jgi:hypothetical protein
VTEAGKSKTYFTFKALLMELQIQRLQISHTLRFQVLTVMSMKMAVLWDDGGSKLPCYLPDCMVQIPEGSHLKITDS